MEIIIIRHAEPDYKNKTLTKKGFYEAELLGRYFKDKKIDYLYCSPLPRAKYTADAIVKHNQIKKYEVLDYLEEFHSLVELPYSKNHLVWDLRPSFLNDDLNLYTKDSWTQNKWLYTSAVETRYNQVKNGFNALLKEHGYQKNGVYYDVLKPNHHKIVIVCHFGMESFLLSELLNISPIALSNHTCALASSITTVVTEEREKGKAIFRMLTFGGIEHLILNNENPSFMARFDEVFGDKTGDEEFE